MMMMMMMMMITEFLIDTTIKVLRTILHVVDWILQIIARLHEVGTSFVDKKMAISTSEPPSTSSSSDPLPPPTTTIVIVGGNFAGLAALWELVNKLSRTMTTKKKTTTTTSVARIVLVDERDYSEYTPGILRLVCDPNHFTNLAQPLPHHLPKAALSMGGSGTIQYQFIHGKVTSVIGTGTGGTSINNNKNSNKVLTYVPATSTTSSNGTTSVTPRTLTYDYLILATGMAYNAPISTAVPTKQHTWESRFDGWRTAHDDLHKARRVLILGGGAVGVELAAEIVYHYSKSMSLSLSSTQKKDITILDAQPGLVTNFPSPVGDYALKWLRKNGVKVLLGQSLLSWNDKSCTLQDGTVLEADIVYVCFGNRPNSQPMTSTTTTSDTSVPALTGGKHVGVGVTLQVGATPSVTTTTTTGTSTVLPDQKVPLYGDGSIFACGDVANPPTNSEKQAFQAEMQGKLAARNVVRLMTTQSSSSSSTSADNDNNNTGLYRYPQDLGETDLLPQLFVLSLGPYDGILGFNTLLIPGPLAAIVKWIIEYTKVLHMRGELLGMLIWKVGDGIVLFLNRTLLQPTPIVRPTGGQSTITKALTLTTVTKKNK